MRKILYLPLLLIAAALPNTVFAHCPLCTAGAGALAVFAASIGVSSIVVGIMIGAFALALSVWVSSMVKKTYIPYQKQIIVGLVYLGTVIPIMPFVRDHAPLYLSLGGEYGSVFHNTYTVNLFIFGVVIGTIIMLSAPQASKYVTKVRGKQVPYQGISIALGVLVITSLIVQVLS